MKDRIGVMLPTIGENEADSSVLLEGKKKEDLIHIKIFLKCIQIIFMNRFLNQRIAML